MISVKATPAERGAPLDGDDIVAHPEVTMDRAFTVDAPIDDAWPWIAQLGKRRAGWYFPRSVERLIPKRRRALRAVDSRYQELSPGDFSPDYGGAAAAFEVALIETGRLIVYRSVRGHTSVSWAIKLTAVDDGRARLHFRLKLGPVKHKRLAEIGGGLVDYVTILGLAAGLQERLRDSERERATPTFEA